MSSATNELDLGKIGVRGINETLQKLPKNTNQRHWLVKNPMGQHAIAVGLDGPLAIDIQGHVGFYCGGMNKESEIIIHGHAGVGVAENDDYVAMATEYRAIAHLPGADKAKIWEPEPVKIYTWGGNA